MKVLTIENPGEPFEALDSVIAHGVTGLDAIKDLLAKMRDLTGGRLKSYEKAGKSLIGKLVNELKQDGSQLGADAIIGLRINVMPIDAKGTSMYAVTIFGTAIKYIEKIHSV